MRRLTYLSFISGGVWRQGDDPGRHCFSTSGAAQRDFAPHFSLPPAVAHMAQHAFSELLNKVLDHSGGTHIALSMRTITLHLRLWVI